jgi:hypothetical protein
VPLSPEQRRLRANLGAASRHRPEAVDELRRDLKASRAEDYIRRLVESAPPLTPEQRDRLALLLRPTRRTPA